MIYIVIYLKIVINRGNVDMVEEYKYLAMKWDKKQEWTQHVDIVYS